MAENEPAHDRMSADHAIPNIAKPTETSTLHGIILLSFNDYHVEKKLYVLGSLVGPNYVLTSAHKLYHPEYGTRPSYIVFMTTLNGGEKIPAIRFHSVESGDYAIIELERDIVKPEDCLNLRVLRPSEIENQECYIYGYCNKIKGDLKSQFYSIKVCASLYEERNLLLYEMKGKYIPIGSSIIYKSPQDNKDYIVGLHQKEFGDGFNEGLLITQEVFDKIHGWMNERTIGTSHNLLSSILPYLSCEDLNSLSSFLEGQPQGLIQAAASNIQTFEIEVSHYIQGLNKIKAAMDKFESLPEESKRILMIACLWDSEDIECDMLLNVCSTDLNIRLQEITGIDTLGYDIKTELFKMYGAMHQDYILKLISVINDEVIQNYSNYLYKHYVLSQDAKEEHIKYLTIKAVEFLRRYNRFIQPSRTAVLYSRIAVVYLRYFSDNNACFEHIRNTEILLRDIEHKDLDVASTYDNLGRIYCYLKRYRDSERCYSECLKIRKAQLSEHHTDIAIGYYNLGAINCHLKAYKESEESYSECLKIIEAAQHGIIEAAGIYGILGILNRHLGKYNSSMKNYEIQLSKTDSQDYTAQANILDCMGQLYNTIGDIAKSKEYCCQCGIMESIQRTNALNLNPKLPRSSK